MLKKIVILLILLGASFLVMLGTTRESLFAVKSQDSFPVSQQELWQKLVNFECWPVWWPGMQESEIVGPLKIGSEVLIRLRGAPNKSSARLVQVKSAEELSWEIPGVFGSQAGTRFLLQPAATGSLLTVENYIRGPQAFMARFTGETAFVEYQQQLLQRLRLALDEKLLPAGEKD